MQEKPKTGKAAIATVFILIGVHIILAWACRPVGIKTGHDDAQYLALSRSIRSLGYSDQFLIGSPAHRMYPPGYPAMLALWGAVTNEKFDLLILLGIAASAATLILLFAVVRRLWSTPLAFLCLAVLSFNPYLVRYAGLVASEAIYTFLSILTLYLLSRKSISKKSMFIAGAAAISAALTRSVGVTLLIAVGLHWLLERRLSALTVFSVASAISVGSWFLWTIKAPQHFIGRSYVADALLRKKASFITVLSNRILDTLNGYAVPGLNHLAFPSIPGKMDSLVGISVAAVSIVIGVIILFKRWRPAALYLLVYGALLIYWPFKQPRFLVPIIPLLVLTLLSGAGSIVRRFKPSLEIAAITTLAMVFTVNGALINISNAKQMTDCRSGTTVLSQNCLDKNQVGFFAAIEYINNNLPEEAKFIVGKPATFYYYTGRKCLARTNLSLHKNRVDFSDIVRHYGVTHVLLSGVHWSDKRLFDHLLENCNTLQLIAKFPPHAFLYRVLQNEEKSENEEACNSLEEFRAIVTAQKRN